MLGEGGFGIVYLALDQYTHRDIEPDSELLAAGPTRETVVVEIADFVLARVPASRSTVMTRHSGGRMGTSPRRSLAVATSGGRSGSDGETGSEGAGRTRNALRIRATDRRGSRDGRAGSPQIRDVTRWHGH